MTFLDYTFFNVICFYFISLINSDEIIEICGEFPFNVLYRFQINVACINSQFLIDCEEF